jgi:hypothetical protein
MTPELPEALVQGREREYLGWFYREFCWQRDAIAQADIDEYLSCYSQPGAMRAGFEYYRALPRDKADNQALLDSGFRLPMPVLAWAGPGLRREAAERSRSSPCAPSHQTSAAARSRGVATSFRGAARVAR